MNQYHWRDGTPLSLNARRVVIAIALPPAIVMAVALRFWRDLRSTFFCAWCDVRSECDAARHFWKEGAE